MTTTVEMDNDTWYIYYNDTDMYLDLQRQAAEMNTIDRERRLFSYVHHTFAGCIVVLNVLMTVSILMRPKQRRHLRTWLILHMTFLHILFAAVALPFLAQMVNTTSAGLRQNIAVCKLLYFLSDVLQYMSNISIGMLGIYQCLHVISPRLLKSVSNILSVSILVILPWFIVVMLTAVLRLTMSEEQWGQCYLVSDETAEILWFLFSFYLPMIIVAGGFVSIVFISFTKFKPKSSPSQQGRRNHVTIFVTICLIACLFLRLPFYIISFKPMLTDCYEVHGRLFCARMTQGMDVARLLSMVFIPLAYLIPREVVKRCRKLKAKVLCRSVDCSTNTKKQQSMELKANPPSERTLL